MIIVRLSEILGRKHLRIADVIRDTGVSRPTLTSLYYGNGKGINFDTLNSLCKYLSVTPGDLFCFYDIEIEGFDAHFDKRKFIRDDNGDIVEAEFDGSVLFKQSKIKNLNFKGALTIANRNHNTHTSIYNATFHFYELSRQEYIANLPDEVEEIVIQELTEHIQDSFSIFDAEAEIGDLTYHYKDSF